MTLIESIINKIDAETILTKGTDLFGHFLSDEEEIVNCVAVVDSMSLKGINVDQEQALVTKNIQVLARNEDYETGYNLMKNIYEIFNYISNYSLDTYYIYHSECLQDDVNWLGLDDKKRHLFSINIQLIIMKQ